MPGLARWEASRWEVPSAPALGRSCLHALARSQEVAHHELVRGLRLDAAKEGSKARQEFELAARELAEKYDKKMKLARDEAELRRKHELHEVWVWAVGGGQCGCSWRVMGLGVLA